MSGTPPADDPTEDVADPALVAPSAYLAAGWRDSAGALRGDLAGLHAFGPALVFQRAEVAPQELAVTLEAIQQILPDTKGTPQDRLATAIEAALETAQAILGIDNSPAVTDWLIACAGFVNTDADLDAFLAHATAVLRQYTALARAVEGEDAEQA